MDKLRNNKRGSDKMISIYWFVILGLVAAGIFAMVYLFYSAPYDVREIEASILTNKVADCISNKGILNQDLFAGEGNFSNDFDFISECNLIFDTEEKDWEGKTQYFFEVSFFGVDDLGNPLFSKAEGNINWKEGCYIFDKDNEDYEVLPK